MKTEYIIIGIIGIVVLYLISKMQSPEPQRVAEFVGSPTAQGSPDTAVREQARLGAFGALAQLGAAQTQSELARFQTGQQLEATRISADVQREGISAGERSRSAELASQERLGFAGFDLQRFLGEVQERLGLRGFDVQENLYAQDLANRIAQMQMQTAAIQNAAQTYRNQSLERQGTILNALTSLYGAQQPYNYVSAFGGPRGPGFFGPGGGFSQIAKLAGGFFGF